MVIYSCCDIKSVDAEGCCNADKHIGFTGFSAEQCPGQDTGRQGHCANMFVCGIKSLGSELQRGNTRMSVQSPLVVLSFSKVRKGGDFFYG